MAMIYFLCEFSLIKKGRRNVKRIHRQPFPYFLALIRSTSRWLVTRYLRAGGVLP
jgi:hypothetical protein